jgi:hypothetical protein
VLFLFDGGGTRGGNEDRVRYDAERGKMKMKRKVGEIEEKIFSREERRGSLITAN